MKLILCFLFGFGAYAQKPTDPVTVFRNGAHSVLMRARLELQELEGIKLQTIIDDINQNKIPIQQGITEVDGRRAALWECKKNQKYIAINPQVTSVILPFVRDVLAVHEHAGASTCSGKDDSYSFALYVWMVSMQDFFVPLFSYFVWPVSAGETVMSYHFRRTNELGGSTVVGGGGDAIDITLKVLSLLCIRSTLAGQGQCLPPELNKNYAQMIKGLIFMNWRMSSDVSEVDKFKIARFNDRKIQPVYLINPKEYNRIVKTLDINTVMQLAIEFAKQLPF